MSDGVDSKPRSRWAHLELAPEPEPEATSDECASGAFGFLRGARDRALAVEFRYRDGSSDWFPYSWLGPWRFHPSVGLLLKFTGDVVTLVLIRGRNLDARTGLGATNLTDNGFGRHRVTWVREADEDEVRRAGPDGPVVHRIDVAEFESTEEMKAWLGRVAPLFLRTSITGLPVL